APDAIDRGYHETMTQAWMRLVHFTLQEFGPKESADAFLDEHTQLLSKRALRFFYSRERIVSAEAKHEFVEPDLARFPVSRQQRDQTKTYIDPQTNRGQACQRRNRPQQIPLSGCNGKR